MTPLCYRCEQRARFLETGNGPRYECQQPGSVVGCYMYQPTRGVVLARDRGDRRWLCGPAMIAARAHGIRIIAEGHSVAREVKDGVAIYSEGEGS